MTTIPRREPDQVMRLARIGSFHQSRLSFMRILTRRMAREAWSFSRPQFEIDANGVGVAVYCVDTGERRYSLVAFAHDLPAEMRSDRVIAQAWDCTFTLFDGVPTSEDISRLSQNVPLQEAGRITQSELSLSRANRSVRLWGHVVDRLAQGVQPDAAEIAKVGYLMRTTAVYGSGKFGAADYETLADRPEFAAPFQVEMLSVYLIRTFVRDLVNHAAVQKGGDGAVALASDLACRLGIGNSTGLGMAPFLLNHPVLINNWITAREEAIARVRSILTVSRNDVARFLELLARTALSCADWRTSHEVQANKIAVLKWDLEQTATFAAQMDWAIERPWDYLVRWSQDHVGLEMQECLASLILEPYAELVDSLADGMSDLGHADRAIDGAMSVAKLRDIITEVYGWARDFDWSAKENCARVWYVSEEKLEPRLGERFDEPIADYEQPLAPARDAIALLNALASWDGAAPVAGFLTSHPEHRHMLKRAQVIANAPYGEIRDNTISATVMPIDLLRCKLSFFGATHFDPRSDRWLRICMFQNAPYPEDLSEQGVMDDWCYPPMGAA